MLAEQPHDLNHYLCGINREGCLQIIFRISLTYSQKLYHAIHTAEIYQTNLNDRRATYEPDQDFTP